MARYVEQKENRYNFDKKFVYIFLLCVILHMVFAGESTFINYLYNTSANPGERTLSAVYVTTLILKKRL